MFLEILNLGLKRLKFDTELDWGDRLIVFDDELNVVYKPKGVGEYYSFEPHFYKNDFNNRIILYCQLGNETYDGGQIYLTENGSFKSIGYIDLVPNNIELKPVDYLKIKSNDSFINFRCVYDSIVVHDELGSDVYPSDVREYNWDGDSLILVDRVFRN